MKDEPNIKQLFSDILDKFKVYDKTQHEQARLVQDVSKLVDKVDASVTKVTEIARDINTLSEKINRIETDVTSMRETFYNMKHLDNWKREVEKNVTADDLKHMKNHYSVVKSIEQKVNEMSASFQEIDERLEVIELEYKLSQRASIASGAGAGALVGGAITTIVQIFKGVSGG